MPSKINKIISKKNKSKIVCLTAYSKNIAEELDKYIDIILVGDSLGSVLYNYKNTRSVTLKMMIEHAKSVRQGISKNLMIVDMPFNTYKNKKVALKNCKKIMQETKCDGVKLEGGSKIKNIVDHLVKNKIPVLGHIGLMPQYTKGKFKSKGKLDREKIRILKDAKILENAGAFGVVLECVTTELASKITKEIKIPTIGIGSSVNCDGQILVSDDIFGLTKSKTKFAKEYTDLKKYIKLAIKKFKKDVLNKRYPNKKYSY